MRPTVLVSGCLAYIEGVPVTSPKDEAASERRFQLVVEAAPNAMVMIDQAGKIVMVNTQAERVFGSP
jgi:PAS domain-containing protein